MGSRTFAEALYQRLPVGLQNLACSYYGWKEKRIRFGPEFQRRLESLAETDRMSRAEIEAYQDEKIADLVDHAYRNVPYYREVMDRLKLKPTDVRGRKDLPKLPILTKEDVRQNLEKLVATNADRRTLIHGHTSGTTGSSLNFYKTRSAVAFQWAVWWRHRTRFGFFPGAWHVNFTGKPVVPPRQQGPPYWRWNRPIRQALINMQHITPATAGEIVGFLDGHGFEAFTGYPSIVHALAMAAAEAGVVLSPGPRLVVTGAENMLDFQRRDIEAFTGAILTDEYGASEGCGNASHCPELVYHEDFEFGVLECCDPSEDGEGRKHGKIVCTGFACPEFPLIRYQIGDAGVWEAPDRPCECGRESTVLLRIEGRVEDYVVTPEGTRIMRFDYLFKSTENVKECQVVQEKLGELKMVIVRRPGYGSAEERTIIEEVHRWISPSMNVTFEYVDEIPREPNGKFRAVKGMRSLGRDER
jgi:phenylacetate-CoA ligase